MGTGKEPPKVVVDGCHVDESTYTYDGRRWNVRTLIKAVEDQKCEVFDLPLAGISLNGLPFQVRHVDDFIFQMNRVANTDLKYPIILDWFGSICDGWHRVVKAIIEGRKTIKAVRLSDMPEPDSVIDKGE